LVHTCTYVCVCLCACMRTYVHVCVYACVHASVHAFVHVCVWIHVCMCALCHVCIHVHVCVRARVRACVGHLHINLIHAPCLYHTQCLDTLRFSRHPRPQYNTTLPGSIYRLGWPLTDTYTYKRYAFTLVVNVSIMTCTYMR
jgi:hypothetical protein